MLSPTRASVLANSSGGSRCENRTCGAVCDALRPSFNSCMNTLPNTTSSSSRKIVLNTTVTLSALASTYLQNFRRDIDTRMLFNAFIVHSLHVHFVRRTHKQTCTLKHERMQQNWIRTAFHLFCSWWRLACCHFRPVLENRNTFRTPMQNNCALINLFCEQLFPNSMEYFLNRLEPTHYNLE